MIGHLILGMGFTGGDRALGLVICLSSQYDNSSISEGSGELGWVKRKKQAQRVKIHGYTDASYAERDSEKFGSETDNEIHLQVCELLPVPLQRDLNSLKSISINAARRSICTQPIDESMIFAPR